MLNTVEDVVRAWGGPKAMAEWIGVTVPAIHHWMYEGAIPPGRALQIYLAARKRGLEINTVDLFGLNEDGEPVDVSLPLPLP